MEKLVEDQRMVRIKSVLVTCDELWWSGLPFLLS